MEDLDQLATLFKALSDPTRLKIIRFLGQRDHATCVNALTTHLDVSQSAVSQHLKVLRQAGVVLGNRMGNFVHYELNNRFFRSIRNRVEKTAGDDFLVISNNGQFFFGPGFWDQHNQIKILEDQLNELQSKKSQIESLISQLKQDDN